MLMYIYFILALPKFVDHPVQNNLHIHYYIGLFVQHEIQKFFLIQLTKMEVILNPCTHPIVVGNQGTTEMTGILVFVLFRGRFPSAYSAAIFEYFCTVCIAALFMNYQLFNMDLLRPIKASYKHKNKPWVIFGSSVHTFCHNASVVTSLAVFSRKYNFFIKFTGIKTFTVYLVNYKSFWAIAMRASEFLSYLHECSFLSLGQSSSHWG